MSGLYDDDLAAIHDAGFGDWARAAANLLIAHAPPGRVIDLGCGSGVLARDVASLGRPVLAVDQSAAMLRLAKERVPEAELRKASLFDVELPSCAAIAIVGEGLNYRVPGAPADHARQVKDRFRSAFAALQPRGILLFDAAGPGRAKGGTKTWSEGKGWAAMAEAVERGDGLERRIITFRQVDGQWRRSEETHTLRLLSPAWLERELRKAGFAVKRLAGYGPLAFPKGHVGFMATKPAT